MPVTYRNTDFIRSSRARLYATGRNQEKQEKQEEEWGESWRRRRRDTGQGGGGQCALYAGARVVGGCSTERLEDVLAFGLGPYGVRLLEHLLLACKRHGVGHPLGVSIVSCGCLVGLCRSSGEEKRRENPSMGISRGAVIPPQCQSRTALARIASQHTMRRQNTRFVRDGCVCMCLWKISLHTCE